MAFIIGHMTTLYATEEIRKDINDILNITREDTTIQSDRVSHVFQLIAPQLKSRSRIKLAEDYLNCEIAASEVLGRNLLTKKFTEKYILFFPNIRTDQRI